MKTKNWIGPLGIGLLLFASHASRAGDDAADETAMSIMAKACDAYKDVQSLKLTAIVSVDELIEDGVKAQRNFVARVSAKRPDKFKSVIQGDSLATVYFDGQQISVIDNKTNNYAQKKMVGTLSDFAIATESLSIPTPMLDFIDSANCHESLKAVKKSQILGEFTLDGEAVTHLHFINKKDKIHWQAWVKKGADRYVVKKALITTAGLREQPQYGFTVYSEELDADVDDAEFNFVAPQGAKKIVLMEDDK